MTQTDETAEFYESRRGDMSLWSKEPSKADVTRGGSIVFSLRFNKDELALLRERAAVAGVTISQFIRRAAIRDAKEGQPMISYAGMRPSYETFLRFEATSFEDAKPPSGKVSLPDHTDDRVWLQAAS